MVSCLFGDFECLLNRRPGRGAEASGARQDGLVPRLSHGATLEPLRPLSGGSRPKVGQSGTRRQLGGALQGDQSAPGQHQQLQLFICIATG